MTAKRKLRRERIAAERTARAEIETIRTSLESAYSSFDNISDPILMDACIYEINSLRAKYNHALRMAKERLME
jgi:Protein of unknown function (DUF2508).